MQTSQYNRYVLEIISGPFLVGSCDNIAFVGWQSDQGVVTNHEYLPVYSVTLPDPLPGVAIWRLGPMECTSYSKYLSEYHICIYKARVKINYEVILLFLFYPLINRLLWNPEQYGHD